MGGKPRIKPSSVCEIWATKKLARMYSPETIALWDHEPALESNEYEIKTWKGSGLRVIYTAGRNGRLDPIYEALSKLVRSALKPYRIKITVELAKDVVDPGEKSHPQPAPAAPSALDGSS